ncbi:unnamed protein product [Trichogramma brassicae]|uniref:Uncharacterized protein n=1 Tax=Trichogramma brassicae TaxID=86971 RepID=A0A6H5I622_9HYME|nr:unnamed protein product [Trichogramma brassicae]
MKGCEQCVKINMQSHVYSRIRVNRCVDDTRVVVVVLFTRRIYRAIELVLNASNTRTIHVALHILLIALKVSIRTISNILDAEKKSRKKCIVTGTLYHPKNRTDVDVALLFRQCNARFDPVDQCDSIITLATFISAATSHRGRKCCGLCRRLVGTIFFIYSRRSDFEALASAALETGFRRLALVTRNSLLLSSSSRRDNPLYNTGHSLSPRRQQQPRIQHESALHRKRKQTCYGLRYIYAHISHDYYGPPNECYVPSMAKLINSRHDLTACMCESTSRRHNVNPTKISHRLQQVVLKKINILNYKILSVLLCMCVISRTMFDEKSDSSFHGEGNDLDSERMDYFNQENVVLSSRSNVQMAEVLLKNGVDPNSADAAGCTALHTICRFQRQDMVEQFFKIIDEIELTVKIDARYNEGISPLHFLMQNNYFCTMETLELLLRRGANPISTNAEGMTPLHFICQKKNDDGIVKKFFKICDEIQQTIEIDARDNEGNTPLHLAMSTGDHWMAELLLRRGAILIQPMPKE